MESSDRALTYEIQWSGPQETYLRTTQWRKGTDGKGAGRPRQTSEFHPTKEATQVIPFLFARYPEGALVLAPRRYYYATTYSWTNYAAQGKDGLWPNYTIDTAASEEELPSRASSICGLRTRRCRRRSSTWTRRSTIAGS